jgi:hypothetical protein
MLALAVRVVEQLLAQIAGRQTREPRHARFAPALKTMADMAGVLDSRVATAPGDQLAGRGEAILVGGRGALALATAGRSGEERADA